MKGFQKYVASQLCTYKNKFTKLVTLHHLQWVIIYNKVISVFRIDTYERK